MSEREMQQFEFESIDNNNNNNKRRIYLVTEGLKSAHTIKAYRIAFKALQRGTIKNDDRVQD